RKPNFEIKRADEIKEFHFNIANQGKWTGQNKDVSDEYLKLLGYWYGDGYKSQKYRIGFNISKEKKDFLLEQITKLNLPIRIYPHGDNAITIHVHEKNLWNAIEGKTFSKRIPRWLFDLPSDKIWMFILGFANADGHIRKNGRI